MRILALTLILLLSACATQTAKAPQPLVPASAACVTASPEDLIKVMEKNKVRFVEKLEKDKARVFMALINRGSPTKLDRVDFVLIFEDEPVFLAAWFMDGCAIAHTVGPWEAIKKLFGQPI